MVMEDELVKVEEVDVKDVEVEIIIENLENLHVLVLMELVVEIQEKVQKDVSIVIFSKYYLLNL